MRTEPPPSSQPLSTMSYCMRAGPAGGIVRARRVEVARDGRQQRLVLGHHAAERVVGRVPAAAARRPTCTSGSGVTQQYGELVRVGEAEATAELDAQAPEDLVGGVGRVGDDEDQVALRGAGGSSGSPPGSRATGTSRRDRGARRPRRPRGGRGRGRRTAWRARSGRRSRGGSRRPCPAPRCP